MTLLETYYGRPSNGKGKWVAGLILALIIGLLLGYLLGYSSSPVISRTVTVTQSIKVESPTTIEKTHTITKTLKKTVSATKTAETIGKEYVARIGEEIHLDSLVLTVDYVNITDRFIITEFGKCYTCSARPNYKIVIVHLMVRNEGARKAYPPSKIGFIIEVDKGYQYEPIWLSRSNRQAWEVNENECLQYYCKEIDPLKELLPEEEVEGCIFFEILEKTNPTKLIYDGYGFIEGKGTKVTIYLTR